MGFLHYSICIIAISTVLARSDGNGRWNRLSKVKSLTGSSSIHPTTSVCTSWEIKEAARDRDKWSWYSTGDHQVDLWVWCWRVCGYRHGMGGSGTSVIELGVMIYDDFPLFFQIYYEFLRIPGGGRRVPASGGDKHIIVSLGVTGRRGTDQDRPYQPPTGRTPIKWLDHETDSSPALLKREGFYPTPLTSLWCNTFSWHQLRCKSPTSHH